MSRYFPQTCLPGGFQVLVELLGTARILVHLRLYRQESGRHGACVVQRLHSLAVERQRTAKVTLLVVLHGPLRALQPVLVALLCVRRRIHDVVSPDLSAKLERSSQLVALQSSQQSLFYLERTLMT